MWGCAPSLRGWSRRPHAQSSWQPSTSSARWLPRAWPFEAVALVIAGDNGGHECAPHPYTPTGSSDAFAYTLGMRPPPPVAPGRLERLIPRLPIAGTAGRRCTATLHRGAAPGRKAGLAKSLLVECAGGGVVRRRRPAGGRGYPHPLGRLQPLRQHASRVVLRPQVGDSGFSPARKAHTWRYISFA